MSRRCKASNISPLLPEFWSKFDLAVHQYVYEHRKAEYLKLEQVHENGGLGTL
jgi:hypothetical protein